MRVLGPNGVVQRARRRGLGGAVQGDVVDFPPCPPPRLACAPCRTNLAGMHRVMGT